MADVAISENYALSLIVKTAIVLAVFWTTVNVLIGFLEFAGMRVELAAGSDNGAVIMTLAAGSFALLAILEFLYVNLLKRTISMKYDDTAVTLSSGLIGKNQTIVPYSGIKSAHVGEVGLKFIDDYLGIATVVVHGDRTVNFPGVKNASQIVKEISDRAAAKKEKKADPMELVMKEITALKTEVTDLRKKLEENEKKERSAREGERPKKKFVLRPFEEAL
ncbi:Uncharacterised protein [uncultured archaeon]|nr:Uncharacterised protein [uncultured archaeon]